MQNEQDPQFQDWVGREYAAQDTLTTAPLTALAATLDRTDNLFEPGDALPLLWHWLYFLEPTRSAQLAADGHPRRGEFLPPIPLPRRMWAGSRLEFLRPLRVGESVTRRSTIKSVTLKQGRSGPLAFVGVAHEISDNAGILLREEHDIVYRDMPAADATASSASKPDMKSDFCKTIAANAVLLFRYSALTFNAHRIHYDRGYAQDTEHYPGLVVHGPLLATLLLELFAEYAPGIELSRFEFKALRPVFDTDEFQCCGTHPDQAGKSRLWVTDSAGNLCMDASAEVKPTP